MESIKEESYLEICKDIPCKKFPIKTNDIVISNTTKKEINRSFEYSLFNSVIDPNNSSPPTEFVMKLMKRIENYSTSKK